MAALSIVGQFQQVSHLDHDSASVKLRTSWDEEHEVTLMTLRLYWNVIKYYNLSIYREKMKKNINKVQISVHKALYKGH